MYTRAITVNVDPARIDEVLALWRDAAVPAARSQTGYVSGRLLIDRASGKGISMFTWETQEQAVATGVGSEHLRAALAHFASYFLAPPVVETYEVGADG